jgi:hypothetical protein
MKMDHLPWRTIALAAYEWCAADDDERAELYKENPKLREVYLSLPGPISALIEKLDSLLWPDLLRWTGYEILDCPGFYGLNTKILQTLPNDEAFDAFLCIGYSTRKEIVNGLIPASKKKVEAGLTKRMIERLDSIRGNPKEMNKFTTTKEFLETLPESARTCYGCFGESIHFSHFFDFQIARCLIHSFHPACSTGSHLCSVIATEEDKANPITSLLLEFSDQGDVKLS